VKRDIIGRTLSLIVAAAMFPMGGCVLGYRLGAALPPDIRTIHVNTFANRCGEPLIENEITRAVVSGFLQDGALRIDVPETADSILEGSVTGFALEPLRYDQDDSRTPNEYRLVLKAQVVFFRRDGEKILLERTLRGESTFELEGDLTSAKAEALPAAAADLAHDIVEAVVEYW